MRNNIGETISELHDIAQTYDPFTIAEYLGIDIRFEDMDRKLLGHCSKILDDAVIILDSSLMDSKQRFLVCAHELFHAVAHQDIASYYSINKYTKNQLEHEANAFSFELIKALFKEVNGFQATHYKQLSEFGIDEDILEYL